MKNYGTSAIMQCWPSETNLALIIQLTDMKPASTFGRNIKKAGLLVRSWTNLPSTKSSTLAGFTFWWGGPVLAAIWSIHSSSTASGTGEKVHRRLCSTRKTDECRYRSRRSFKKKTKRKKGDVSFKINGWSKWWSRNYSLNAVVNNKPQLFTFDLAIVMIKNKFRLTTTCIWFTWPHIKEWDCFIRLKKKKEVLSHISTFFRIWP